MKSCIFVLLVALFWCAEPLATEVSVASTGPGASSTLTYIVNEVAAEPYQIITGQGRHEGLVTDIVRELLKGTGIRWQVESHPYRRVQRLLGSPTSGHWICYGAEGWLRPDALARSVLMEPALFVTHFQLVGRRGGPADPIADARRARIIVIHGYRYGERFASWVRDSGHTLVEAPSHQHALAMLRQRRGDYYLAEYIRVDWEIARAGGGREDLSIHDFSALLAPTPIHLIHNRDLPEAQARVLVERLRAMAAAGTLEALYGRYRRP